MKFHVEVHWISKSNNPCCRKATVDAETAAAAWQQVAGKVKKYARFSKLVGGGARPAISPAPRVCVAAKRRAAKGGRANVRK